MPLVSLSRCNLLRRRSGKRLLFQLHTPRLSWYIWLCNWARILLLIFPKCKKWGRISASGSARCLNWTASASKKRYRSKVILNAQLSGCKVRTPSTEWDEQNSSDASAKQPLPSPRLLLCSSLLPGQRSGGENHSRPQTAERSAAAICHHPLDNQSAPASGL